MPAQSHSFNINSTWGFLRGNTKHHPTDGGSALKCINIQENIVHDADGRVNDGDLEHYCYINNYRIGQYIQVFTRQPVVLNNTKIDIFHEFIKCIEYQFEAIDSALSVRWNKRKIQPQTLPVRGSKDIVYDHIYLTVRSHTFYLLFGDVLYSKYCQDDDSDDTEIPGKNSWWLSW